MNPNTSKQCGTGEEHVTREDSASYRGINCHFLNMILDELMSWHSQTYDFSKLEVNKYMLHVLE